MDVYRIGTCIYNAYSNDNNILRETFHKTVVGNESPGRFISGINRCSGLANGVLHRLVLSAAAGAMPTCVPAICVCIILCSAYKICTYLPFRTYIYIYVLYHTLCTRPRTLQPRRYVYIKLKKIVFRMTTTAARGTAAKIGR